MDNVYGSELDLKIGKFKSKIKQASVISQNFEKQIASMDEEMRQLGVLIEKNRVAKIDTSKAEANLEALGNKLEKLKLKDLEKGLLSVKNIEFSPTSIDGLGKFAVQGAGLANSMSKLEGELPYVAKDINDLAIESEEASDNMSDLSENGKKTSGEISKAFTKGLKSVKKLTLGFLGARTAFSLFRKYMSEYQSQNEEFANKMQLTTNVIVNALAPAFEWFGNVIQYAVIGLARIIELLTGVNILAKTVDNGFKGASKSAKEFNDNLSGLDEISNISESGGGLATGIGGQLKALGDFQDKIKEVDKWFKENPIGKAIKWIADFVKEHPWATLLGLGTFKLLKGAIIPALVGGVSGLSGAFIALGTAIALAFAIEQWVNLIDKIKEAIDAVKHYHEVLEEGQKQTENNINANKDIVEQLQKKIKDNTITPDEWNLYQIALKNIIDDLNLQNSLIKDSASPWEKLVGYSDETKKKLEANNTEITKYLDIINKIPTEKKIYVEADLDLNSYKFDKKVKQVFGGITNFIESAKMGKLNSYDVGTNYVPHDQVALIHEGERIIPKKYNNSDYLGQLGSSETNALLIELNRNVLEFAKRPSVISVNGKDLAKATYSDYQEESSRRGTNTSVRRV